LKPGDDDALARKLEGLLARVQQSAPGAPDPTLQHQLGDVYADLNRRTEALGAYGRAIDGFLTSGRVSVGLAVCNKVIKRFAGVTRTHFTVGCCLLYLGRTDEALRAFAAYAQATIKSDTTSLAIPRLRFLAKILTDANVRGTLAGFLEQVGDDEADRVRRGDPSAHAMTLTPEKRAELLIQLATWGADALWSTFWLR
jgi:hypothetical protein